MPYETCRFRCYHPSGELPVETHMPQLIASIRPLVVALTLLAWCGPCVGQNGKPNSSGGGAGDATDKQRSTASQTLERQVYECFVRQDYAKVVTLINAHLKTAPGDADMLYNLACAYCLLDDDDRSATALLRAFKAGFSDIEHMRSDPDLQGLREHPTFRRILEEADKVSLRRTRDALKLWQAAYGSENYTYESDKERRINYAVALDAESFKSVRTMLEREADQVNRTLFNGQTPGYDVLIAIPTPEDADDFFNGQDDIGGMYQHSMRRLVARDIGGSLRHEFFHALHYADMERTRQRHPLWLQEGLATLYEDYEIDAAGDIKFLPNDRQMLAKSRAKAGRLVKLNDLFAMNAEMFMDKAQQHYPQVRSLFEYVADQGKLVEWYQMYVKTFDDDPTSAKAFEQVFAKPLDEIERDWRKWQIAQPSIDLNIGDDDAALGIRSDENLANDGVLVTYVIPGSSASRSGIRHRDVIVAVDGRSTPSLIDLRKVIAVKSVGDEVQVKLRRGEEYHTLRVKLRPLAGGY